MLTATCWGRHAHALRCLTPPTPARRYRAATMSRGASKSEAGCLAWLCWLYDTLPENGTNREVGWCCPAHAHSHTRTELARRVNAYASGECLRMKCPPRFATLVTQPASTPVATTRGPSASGEHGVWRSASTTLPCARSGPSPHRRPWPDGRDPTAGCWPWSDSCNAVKLARRGFVVGVSHELWRRAQLRRRC